ncbi:MAG TPA: MBL fold metallo-hydrolase [Clostridia bacterium]|nr:MBL fold metallo-hydrolase [Clostridia bacterium]
MKLTILGKYGPFPAPLGACSGYLLESEGISLVLDFGSGTLSRLLQLKPTLDISAVLLSHLHSDHISDMFILRYALQQLEARGMRSSPIVSVAMPNDPSMEFSALSASGVYDIQQVHDGTRLRFGDMLISFHRGTHPVPSYSIDITHLGKRFVYTGDTGYREELVDLCKDADMLLADTGYLNADKVSRVAAHLTTGEVGRLARDANVKRLICTHIWPGYTDEQVLLEVSANFPSAEIAQEGAVYEV